MRLSPLDGEHRTLGARMVPFGGWEMPLAYPSGTLAEHAACRDAAAVFDVSHLGTVRVEGSDAAERIQLAFTNDIKRISPGRAQYTHLLDVDGSVLDDIIVWWRDSGLVDVMPNAANTERVLSAVGGRDVTGERAVIAVQGPTARAVVGMLSVEAASVPRFGVAPAFMAGVDVVVAGTGYTGEDGVEIAIPRDAAPQVWQQLLLAGAVPAGLGARDTLRLEAGLPLHGHELGPGISPLQAGLGWVVAWEKTEVRGMSALLEERAHGSSRLLRGVATEGRRPAREGSEVRSPGGGTLGRVTSGNFSPTLGHGIALALLETGVRVGDEVVIEDRGTDLPGRVVETPFVR